MLERRDTTQLANAGLIEEGGVGRDQRVNEAHKEGNSEHLGWCYNVGNRRRKRAYLHSGSHLRNHRHVLLFLFFSVRLCLTL